MAVTIDREAQVLAGHDNFAQVEDNHISAKRDGRVYGQLPADKAIDTLEQGMFVKYDYANGAVKFTGDGPWMMVYNEEKLYDERKQMHRDYAMQRSAFYDGEMYPRVLGIVPGDIWTTNALAKGSYKVGDKVAPGSDGFLAAGEGDGELVCQVVKETTMPDGQPAVKLQCIVA